MYFNGVGVITIATHLNLDVSDVNEIIDYLNEIYV